MTVLLSATSLKRLDDIHADLARVVLRCAKDFSSPLEFMVLEGIRSRARQLQCVQCGASRTMDSRHLTGHAVDLGAKVAGEVRWDWPLYHTLAAEMKKAAEAEGIEIEWGGDWASFPDGPHFQLPRDKYPAPAQA